MRRRGRVLLAPGGGGEAVCLPAGKGLAEQAGSAQRDSEHGGRLLRGGRRARAFCPPAAGGEVHSGQRQAQMLQDYLIGCEWVGEEGRRGAESAPVGPLNPAHLQ